MARECALRASSSPSVLYSGNEQCVQFGVPVAPALVTDLAAGGALLSLRLNLPPKLIESLPLQCFAPGLEWRACACGGGVLWPGTHPLAHVALLRTCGVSWTRFWFGHWNLYVRPLEYW